MAKKKTESKAVIHLDENSHLPQFFFRTRIIPKTDEEIEALGHELVMWSSEGDGISLEEFAKGKFMGIQRLYDYAERNPTFKECMKLAHQAIGCRRERRALEGKFNANLVLATMPMYNPRYKKLIEWKASLQKEQNNSNETKIVVIDRIPNSTMVPERSEVAVKPKGSDDQDTE